MSKLFTRLNYNELIINGEVNERLPLYTNNIYNIFPLDNDINSSFPNYIIENGLLNNSTSLNKSNVTISNNIMSFTGNSNSYIELDKSIMNSPQLELEFNFKITDFSTESTLFSSQDLTIKINAINKFIYAEMPNLTGKHTPKPDYNNAFKFTNDNSIKLNTWHRLKVFKYEAIVIVLLDFNITKALVCENGFNPTISYLGKGLKGQIKKMSITHRKKITNSLSINLPNIYTLTAIINIKQYNTFDLLTIGSLKVKLNNNNLVITKDTTTLLNQAIKTNNDYGFVCTFENNNLSIFIRDYITDKILLNINNISLNYSNTAVVNTNYNIYNLGIYNKKLNNLIIEDLNKKRFSLNKDGDILYEIDEINMNSKLINNTGRKYHLQLTRDLNSKCNTIKNNNAIIDYVYGGALSKLDSRKIKILFANQINLANIFEIIYKTKITKLKDNKHYDSLGNGLYWGIENNKFIIRYNNLVSEINNVNANEFIDEWILISIAYSSSNIRMMIYTSKGIYNASINSLINNITNNNYKYDLLLGGKEDELYGEAIYRDLNIINNWNIENKHKENMFRTKLSYTNNKLIADVDIIEKL